jgi:hypothetical protein
VEGEGLAHFCALVTSYQDVHAGAVAREVQKAPVGVIAIDCTEVHAQWCSGDGLVLVQTGCASTRSGRLGVKRSAVPGRGAPLQVQQQPEGPRGGLDVERVPPRQP